MRTDPPTLPDNLGTLEYDRILRDPKIRSASDALRACLMAHPKAFEDAALSIAPIAWRLLLQSHNYHWVLIIDPSIDIRQQLRQAADAGHDVPSEWLKGHTPQDVSDSLRQDLSYAEEDSARAAWLILSFVKSRHLEVEEIINLEWWKPRWLHALLVQTP